MSLCEGVDRNNCLLIRDFHAPLFSKKPKEDWEGLGSCGQSRVLNSLTN